MRGELGTYGASLPTRASSITCASRHNALPLATWALRKRFAASPPSATAMATGKNALPLGRNFITTFEPNGAALETGPAFLAKTQPTGPAGPVLRLGCWTLPPLAGPTLTAGRQHFCDISHINHHSMHQWILQPLLAREKVRRDVGITAAKTLTGLGRALSL